MPITSSAIKKVRGDRKKTSVNRPIASKMRNAVKAAKAKPNAETVRLAYSAIDKALKNKIIKKNNAARQKSRLVKSLKNSAKTSLFAKVKPKTKASPKTKAK